MLRGQMANTAVPIITRQKVPSARTHNPMTNVFAFRLYGVITHKDHYFADCSIFAQAKITAFYVKQGDAQSATRSTDNWLSLL